MTDIVERLRYCDKSSAQAMNGSRIFGEAADEIERLRGDIERLRAALKAVGDDYPGSSCQQWCYEQAGIPLPNANAAIDAAREKP